jgi:hypothetical protein
VSLEIDHSVPFIPAISAAAMFRFACCRVHPHRAVHRLRAASRSTHTEGVRRPRVTSRRPPGAARTHVCAGPLPEAVDGRPCPFIEVPAISGGGPKHPRPRPAGDAGRVAGRGGHGLIDPWWPDPTYDEDEEDEL